MPAILIVLAVLLIALWYAVTRGGELSIVSPGRAAALLAEVETKAALPVRRRGPVERSGPDGPMPEIAGRQLVIASNAASITARVRHACQSLGLAPADAGSRAIEPDLLCDGGEGRDGDGVYLSLTCADTCTAYLQTQVLGF